MKRLKKWPAFVALLVFCAELLCIAPAPQGLAQEGRPKIRISYPSISVANLGVFAAQPWKIFEQNGLGIKSVQSKNKGTDCDGSPVGKSFRACDGH
jgi:hypothetical protein